MSSYGEAKPAYEEKHESYGGKHNSAASMPSYGDSVPAASYGGNYPLQSLRTEANHHTADPSHLIAINLIKFKSSFANKFNS